MQSVPNAILNRESIPTVNIEGLNRDLLVRREPEENNSREMSVLFRKQSAAAFIGPLRPGLRVFGFSKGQFSLIDVVEHLLNQKPGGALSVSTWTAASADLSRLESLIATADLESVRFMVDFSFQRRQPGLIARIRARYGSESIRALKNHAKFLLYSAGDLRIVCRTSMNLNHNPRLEDLEIADDPKLFEFLDRIVAHVFQHFSHGTAPTKTVREHNLDFAQLRLD